MFSIVNVFRKYWDRKWEILSHWRCFGYLTITLTALMLFAEDSEICKRYPKLVILTFGFCFSQLSCKILIQTITESKVFEQDTLSNNIFYLMTIISILAKPYIGPVPLDLVLVFGFLLCTVEWFVYYNRITNEMADILGIYRFKVGKRKTSA